MIDAEKANYTISRMCRLLNIDRRRYYEWAKRRAAGPSAAEQRRAELTGKIVEFHKASDGTYGAPRIVHDLREAGEIVSVKTVAKCMRQAEIAGISPRTWHPPTTVPGPNPDPAPDLVKRVFDQGRRDVAWFSDITYLATGEGWGYLCTVRDGHTRRVLGRSVADHLRADLVEDTLRQAVALRGELPGKVIFHADRGCQGGFNWSSQHLDHGGVWWRRATGAGRRAMRLRGCGGSGVLIGRCGRRCAHRGDLTPRGWCSGSSGDRSPRALRRRRHRSLSGCRSRWGCVGFVTLAACRRSALPSPQGAI